MNRAVVNLNPAADGPDTRQRPPEGTRDLGHPHCDHGHRRLVSRTC